MQKLNFTLPDLGTEKTTSLEPGPKLLKSWLDELPLGDMEASGLQVLSALQAYNRVVLTPSERLQTLNIFGRVVQELTAGLTSKYRDSTFPLSERNRQRYQLVDKLLEEIAFGFKRLVLDLHNKWNQTQMPSRELFDAIRISIVYLAKRLVAAYGTYSTEPAGIWRDLHQLYMLANQFQIKYSEKNYTSQIQQVTDVIHAYLRIVMLSITNPYHLMQGEAQLIYNYLNKWVAGCRIVLLSGNQLHNGDLVIDLDSDFAPQFVYCDDFHRPRNARTVDMENLLLRFKQTISGLTTRKQSAGGIENANMTFNERIRRDMLFRLQTVWNNRMQRAGERVASSEKLQLVSSLSATHFFVDGQKEFFPESDEVRIHKPERNLTSSEQVLSLVPIDYEPWKDEDDINSIETDFENKRISLFNEDLDIWEKIFASKSHARAMHQKHAMHYKSHTWNQTNSSDHGLGLRYEATENARVSVGNIVAYYSDIGKKWCLGVVTWMKEQTINQFHMGVRLINGMPEAVAVRAISGTGSGSEYFRCLQLSESSENNNSTKLIVPASIYDVGTQVVLNYRDKLIYVQLTDMIKTTTCYSMFRYQVIEVPAVEQNKIIQIKSA